jgi:hypothetical protein
MTSKSKANQILIVLIPFLLALIIMAPRLLSPQFGLMDDSATLSQAQRFLNGDFSMSHDLQAGRFRPVYWLYYTLIYALAGYQPFWFFLGNLILLFILLIEIRLLVKNAGGKEWQAALASCLFLLSMPFIESFYTLSKGEPLQLILILGALIQFDQIQKNHKRTWLRLFFITLLLFSAILVKETAIIMLPLSALWAVYAVLANRKSKAHTEPKTWALVGAALVATLAYFILRNTFQATALLGGTYTNKYLVDIGELLRKLLRWITQFAFYFHYFVPVLALGLYLVIAKISIPKPLKFALFRWFTWWVVWFVVFIPWEFAEIYYLLPFSLSGAMLVSLAAPLILKQAKGRVGVIALTILSAALFLLTLPNYVTNAQLQLAFDKANSEMLAYVSEHTPSNSTILMNINTYNEYSEKTKDIIYDHYHRNDIDYQNIDTDLMNQIAKQAGAYVLVPTIDNQPTLSVRAGVEEYYQDQTNQTFYHQTDNLRDLQFSTEETFRLFNVNLPVVLCQIGLDAGFCQNPDPIIDTQPFSYGWEIYQLQ